MMTASNDRCISRSRRVASHPVLRRVLGILIAVALLAPALVSPTSAPAVRADGLSDAIAEQQRLAQLIAEQKAQLAQLTAQQATLAGQIATTNQNLTDVRGSIDQLKGEIGSIANQLTAVSSTYAEVLWQQTTLRQQQAQVAARAASEQFQLEQRQRVLADRLAAAYETDQTPLLQQLLSAHSLTDAMSDVSSYTDLAAQDKILADQIQSQKRLVDELWQDVTLAASATDASAAQALSQRQLLDDQKAQYAEAQTQLTDLQKQLEAQLAEQQAAQTKLAHDKSALSATVTSNGQALDSLGNQIDQLIRKQGSAGKILSQFSGTLAWPMGGVITQEFGCTGVVSEPRVGSCAHFHQGIDIAAPCRTPVFSAAAGEVVFVGYNPYDAPPRAWLVIIAHSSSMVTWYAHMTAQAPAGIYVGARVAAGQLVGTENSTGHSTGCHLHWAVRVNGVFVNPRLFL